MDSKPDERRSHYRLGGSLPEVTVIVGGKTLAAHMVNLSPGGCAISAPLKKRPGTRVTIKIPAMGETVEAELVSSDKTGARFRFETPLRKAEALGNFGDLIRKSKALRSED